MYREYPSKSDVVTCTWERRSPPVVAQLIVPDGCLDLVWFGDGRMELVGPDTAPLLEDNRRPAQ